MSFLGASLGSFFLSLLMMASPAHGLVNGAPLIGVSDVVRIRLPNTYVCTGAYIDAYTILTAAHCVAERSDVSKVVIETEGDQRLAVHVRKLISHPSYTGGFFPHADIGLIKTDRNPNFKGTFKLGEKSPGRFGSARLFGPGRKKAFGFEYFRTTGRNSFLHLGEYLYFKGPLKDAIVGENVSIAHSDSGGAILNSETNVIIAVIVQSTVDQSTRLNSPVLSLGTLITTPENSRFVRSHLGFE